VTERTKIVFIATEQPDWHLSVVERGGAAACRVAAACRAGDRRGYAIRQPQRLDRASNWSTRNNVVMLRNILEIYALAGLRLGWGYFPPRSPMC